MTDLSTDPVLSGCLAALRGDPADGAACAAAVDRLQELDASTADVLLWYARPPAWVREAIVPAGAGWTPAAFDLAMKAAGIDLSAPVQAGRGKLLAGGRATVYRQPVPPEEDDSLRGVVALWEESVRGRPRVAAVARGLAVTGGHVVEGHGLCVQGGDGRCRCRSPHGTEPPPRDRADAARRLKWRVLEMYDYDKDVVIPLYPPTVAEADVPALLRSVGIQLPADTALRIAVRPSRLIPSPPARVTLPVAWP